MYLEDLNYPLISGSTNDLENVLLNKLYIFKDRYDFSFTLAHVSLGISKDVQFSKST